MNRSAENFSPSETDKFTGYVGKRINLTQTNNPYDIKYQLIEDRIDVIDMSKMDFKSPF